MKPPLQTRLLGTLTVKQIKTAERLAGPIADRLEKQPPQLALATLLTLAGSLINVLTDDPAEREILLDMFCADLRDSVTIIDRISRKNVASLRPESGS